MQPICEMQHGIHHQDGRFQTKAMPTITYGSIVSRETIRVALKIATLNDVEVKKDDMLNAHVQVSFMGKVWATLNTAVIARALYGLKSERAAFKILLAKCMESLENTYLVRLNWLKRRNHTRRWGTVFLLPIVLCG